MNVEGLKMNLADRSNWVAIIGSRNASPAEKQTAFTMAKHLAKRGDIIVSGLARGIDSAGHKGAIAGGGKTIAIVSTILGEPIYPPENRGLAEEIKKHGCIIHPFKTKSKYSKGFSQGMKRLMERSILNAYVCPNIIVVKNSSLSITGGTKWATKFGMDIGHKVYRLDNNMKFHENPEVDNCVVSWIREVNVETFLKELDNYK